MTAPVANPIGRAEINGLIFNPYSKDFIRNPDPDDARAQMLTPSPEGSARLARIREARRARWESDLGDWPAEDIATLAGLLARFNRVREARDAQPDA